MYQFTQSKAKYIQKSYRIDSFPIPIWQIEQIIIDQGFDLVISTKNKSSCIMKSTVFIPRVNDSIARIMLSHELGHILFHNYSITSVNPITKRKYEALADAFAAYFLMPSGHFEEHASAMTIYDLSEFYGVPVNFINKRMELSIDLIQ
jgi:Zn-dependent peptidase ImmA (M78 family)